MSEDKVKYYTPSIEELFVGYEYEEANEAILTSYTKWEKYIIKEAWQIAEVGKYVPIRTPYLTKEQIEAEGWEFIINDLGFPEYYKKGSFHMILRNGRIYEIIKIDFKNSEEYSKPRPTYIGIIKSINELRKIQKWLGII